MLFTWANNEKVQEDIMEQKSMEDINKFIERQPKLLFIIDQINALDAEREGADTVSNSTKEYVRKQIEAFTSQHKAIFSASVNYQARLRMETKQTNDWKLYVYGGFSTVSPPNTTL